VSELHPTYPKIQNVFKLDPDTKLRSEEAGWTCNEFRFLRQNEWIVTEKVDGTNIRVMWNGASMSVNGKSDSANVPGDLIQHLYERFDPRRLEETFGGSFVTIYGEGYGGSIQSPMGMKYSPAKTFVAFDILIGDFWLRQPDVFEICQKLEIPMVPLLGVVTLDRAIEMARHGVKSTYGDFLAEGVIAKPATELRFRNGERIVAKIKTKDFAPVHKEKAA
jgi:hypothetical protein